METREQIVLNRTINNLFRQKQDYKELDEAIKKNVSFIKQRLIENELKNYETEQCKAVLTEQHKQSIDEDKLIQILKDNLEKDNLDKVVRTKLYVDYEALESLIYNGKISAEKIEPAQSTKTTYMLNVKPLKVMKEREENE